VFIVEGNMGVGKSTFLKIIQQSLPRVIVEQEPVDRWQHQVGGQSLLSQFYNDPVRWAYTFELATLMNRIQHYADARERNDGVVIMERSLYSGYYCFAYNSHKQGFMNACEWMLYQEWFDMLVTKAACIPQGFIYLRTNPAVAYERIKKRARGAEETMDYEYVVQLHERHEAFLIDKIGILPALAKLPVLTIDVDEDFEYNDVHRKLIIEQVDRFIQQIITR
jgi:deoxyadenosine/deoxycytidine kinase